MSYFPTPEKTGNLVLTGNGGFPYISSNAFLFEQFILSGTVSGGVVPLNLLADADSALNTTANGEIDLLRLEMTTNAGIQGNRVGLSTTINLAAASGNSAGTSLYGGVFDATASAPDGGTSGLNNQRGSLQALNAQARLYNSATNFAMVNGAEIDVGIELGSSAGYKVGLLIVQQTDDVVQGTYEDIALAVANDGVASGNGGAGWLGGLSFGSKWAAWPIAPTGTIIKAQPNTLTVGFVNDLTAARGIDFSAVTFSDYSILMPGFSVTGSGNATAHVLSSLTSINATDNISAGTSLSANTVVTAGTDVAAGASVTAGTYVAASSHLTVGTSGNILTVTPGGTATAAIVLAQSGSGGITVNTPIAADNSTQIATTAFVKNQSYVTASTAPVISVAGRSGAIVLSVSDISAAAPLASPSFTGSPISTTPSTSDNSTNIATTAYVKNQNYVTASTAPVTSVAGRSGAITLAVADVTDAQSVMQKGQPSGYPSLDTSGFIPISQLPASVQGALTYYGSWNASINTPTLTSGVGSNGALYIVSVSGTTSLDGVSLWNVGDEVVFNGTTWQRIPNIQTVTSVAGRTGTITLAVSDITGAAPLASPSFTGSPISTTPSTSDNSTNIATTAYVKNQSYVTASTVPVTSVAGRTGAIVLSVSDVSGAAPSASPSFTGSPVSTTPTGSDNSTNIATTAYVKNQNYVTGDALGFITVVPNGTDDTANINAAISTAAGTKEVVLSNTGTNYIISSPILPTANTKLIGVGQPTIFLKAGSNCAVIQSANFQTDIVTPVYPSDDNITIRGLVIDGNRTNQTASSNPDYQNGIAIYGQLPRIEENIVQNAYAHGMRIAGESGIDAIREPIVRDNKIYSSGRNGIWYQGPSDGYFADNIVVDAGQAADNTYYAFRMDTSGRIFNFHGWHKSTATNRVAYQGYLNSTGIDVSGSHFEGGRKQLWLAAGQARISGSEIYSNFGAAGNELVTVSSNDNQFIGNFLWNNGAPSATNGIALTASAAGNLFSSNKFSGLATSTTAEYIFTSDGGLNVINGDLSYQPATATSTITGYSATDTIDFDRYVAYGGTAQNIHLTPNSLTIGGHLSIAGSLMRNVRIVTAAGSVVITTSDAIVIVIKTVGAATTVILPSTPLSGQWLTIKDGKGDAGTNNITISGGTIDGMTSNVLTFNYQSTDLAFNGSGWSIV